MKKKKQRVLISRMSSRFAPFFMVPGATLYLTSLETDPGSSITCHWGLNKPILYEPTIDYMGVIHHQNEAYQVFR